MAIDMTSFAAALKTLYPKDVLKDLTYQDNPLLALLPKEENAGGDSIKVPIIIGNPQGRSAALSTAITNKGNSTIKAFSLTRVSDYGVASINRETMLASEGDMMAFAKARKVEVDGIVNTVSRSLAKALYGAGTGILGQISSGSTVGSTTITLSDINDITNFEVGMKVKAYQNATGSSARGNAGTIVGINRQTGTLSFAGNWDTATGCSASDYLAQDGDYGSMLSGLGAWIPSSAPAATTFFGVDRTADTSRLGGVRHDGAGQTVEEALIDLCRKVAREGGKTSHVFLNPVQVGNLVKSLSSKVNYDVAKSADADIGFDSIKLYTPNGIVQVVSDYNCPATKGYALKMDTWKLYSIQAAPHIFDLDNDQKLLREATTDGYELRVGYYAQLGCSAPGHNGVVTLDAAV
jgi:hypothetical protein